MDRSKDRATTGLKPAFSAAVMSTNGVSAANAWLTFNSSIRGREFVYREFSRTTWF
jgi:hypothetical protein